MWIPLFKWVDSPISASPVADRCIKSHPCDLHRQTLVVEWPYGRAQWLSTWQHHRMPPFQQVSHISALLELLRSTVSAVIVKWNRLGATTSQLRSGRPHKLTELDRWRAHCVKIVCPRLQHSLPSSKLEAKSARTVRRELRETGFHGRAAAHKPKITMRNAKRWLEWCYVCHHRKHILWSDESSFSIW
jgi:hypothetical protein